MDQSHGDENKKGAEERSTNSKKAENLDSPQFQEVIRGFMIEKELLEKRHQEEIEKLRENFSIKENALLESHAGQIIDESSQFGHSSSAMAGNSMQTQKMMNGSSQQNEETYSAGQLQGGHASGSGGAHSRNLSPSLQTSYQVQDSGSLSTIQNGTSGARGMVNGLAAHAGQIVGDIGVMNGGVSHFQSGSINGTSHHEINGHHSYHSKNKNMGYHAISSDNQYGGSTGQHGGIYHTASTKSAHHSTSWNPTFYTQNLLPARENNGGKVLSGSDIYGVSLELMNGPSMRVNTDNLASQIRPDLDIEDRLEQQMEVLQQRFAVEKRQLRQILQEEFVRKFETEKRKHEEAIQTLKKTNLELEYQKREFEVKVRHERENLELRFETQRTEYERKCRKQSEEHRSKMDSKYEVEIMQQKTTYEGIIVKLKSDIKSLTLQLEEQNENLKCEKDNVVAAFEKEITEFKERMRVEKERTDSELAVKLKSEISLLTSVNKSLREEVENKEREKQELERMTKEERTRAEFNFEKQISEIEEHFEMEKKALLAQYEEKVTLLLKNEKSAIEETSQKSNEHLNALKRENETLKEIVENSYKMEQEASLEREELVQSLMEEKNLLETQLQGLVAKQQCDETRSKEEHDRHVLNAQIQLKESNEFSSKVQRDLKHMRDERNALISKVEVLMTEISELKKEKLNGSVVKDEKDTLLKEVSKLNEEIDKMFEDLQEKGRKEVSLKENLSELEETLHQQENENTQLKLESMEAHNNLSIFNRQMDDLKHDLSIMRRKNVELEEEKCNLKKDKSSVDGMLAVLQTTHDSLVQEHEKAKQKISQLAEELSALKLQKLELQQELRMVKMQQTNYKDVTQRLNAVSDSDTSGSVLTSADEAAEKNHTKKKKKRSILEKEISKLKRQKSEYELRVERLKQDVESLEREALKQIEHNKTISADFVSKKEEFEGKMDELKRQREALEASIVKVQREEDGVRNNMSVLVKQRAELQHSVELLGEEEERFRLSSESETQRISQDLENGVQQLQQQIVSLESNKRELQEEVERLEHDETSLRCSIEELQRESQLLSQRITQMKESVLETGRKRVSWVESKASDGVSSLGYDEVMEEVTKLRRERDGLIRNVNELERKQTDLDISVECVEKNIHACEREIDALSRKRSELESAIFTLKTEKFELETRVHELSAISMESVTNTQRKEMEMLRNELEITRESCEDIRSMYHSVQHEGKSTVDVVETELRLAEDNLMRLKRERLELEKTISTLLRQKTELESEVALIVDSKSREDRDTRALREERLNLDTELVRLRSQVSEFRSMLANLEDTKAVTEHELRGLETRKDRVDSYVSGMEARLVIGRKSPISWNFTPSKEFVLTPLDDLEKQVLELREQKLSLEADLFKLRRKSGDGIDTRNCQEGTFGIPRANLVHVGTAGDFRGHCGYSHNAGLHQDIDVLAQQKSKLSSEVQEMQVIKTDLDAQITNLEYRKLGLEQTGRLVIKPENEELVEQSRRMVTSVENGDIAEQTGKMPKRQEEEGLAEQSGSLITRWQYESSDIKAEANFTEEYFIQTDFVNYSVEQMQELRQKNTSLENKLSFLENHLHEAKYEMEKQTLEYQKELKLVQNALMSQQQSESGQHEQLAVTVERLKKFIEESKIPETDELYEEIKQEIRTLNRKVELNGEKMKAIQEGKLKMEKPSPEIKITTQHVDEISANILDAEWNIERYNEVVSHLQKENDDLMDIVARLEDRLSAAGKSHEILQRKKVILQQLLETVSVKTGDDLIEQSNLIFELDKDKAI